MARPAIMKRQNYTFKAKIGKSTARIIHSKNNHGILQVVKIMYENHLKSSRISAIINFHSPRSFEMGCEAGKTASAFLTDGRS
jgi:hypothetical protein